MDDAIQLHHSTGNWKIDEIIRGIVGLTELIFPGQVRGYYLVGSYGNGRTIASSDLDLYPDEHVFDELSRLVSENDEALPEHVRTALQRLCTAFGEQ